MLHHALLTSVLARAGTLDVRLLRDAAPVAASAGASSHAYDSAETPLGTASRGPRSAHPQQGDAFWAPGAGGAAATRDTVLTSLFMRRLAVQFNSTKLRALGQPRRHLAAAANRAAQQGATSPSVTVRTPPVLRPAVLPPNVSVLPTTPAPLMRSTVSAGVPNTAVSASSAQVSHNTSTATGVGGGNPSQKPAHVRSSPLSPAPVAGGAAPSTPWRDRATVSISSEQAIATVPLHELDAMHVHHYLEPWTQLARTVRRSQSAAMRAASKHAAGGAAWPDESAHTYASTTTGTHEHGWTDDEEHAPLDTGGERAGADDFDALALLTSPRHRARAHRPRSAVRARGAALVLTCVLHLRGVSVVVIPVPTVMLTYHLDLFWARLSRPNADEMSVWLAIGKADDADQQRSSHAEHHHHRARGAAAMATADSDGAAALSDGASGAVPGHKLTLHSANARRRKHRGHTTAASQLRPACQHVSGWSAVRRA